MAEKEYIKLEVHRTLCPKPYHSIKIGLEMSVVCEEDENFTSDGRETEINVLYATMKKKLNEIEQYELSRF